MKDLKPRISIHWFRRDLRLHDNHGLFRALTEHGNVLALFIFDTNILGRLEDPSDRRVDLIHRTLSELREQLGSYGSSLLVEHGDPLEVWKKILDQYSVTAVTLNHDHEPYSIERDGSIEKLLKEFGIPFRTFKDISIFERSEVTKDDGNPYSVYTPYMRKWKSGFSPAMCNAFPSMDHSTEFWRTSPLAFPTLSDIGFQPTDLAVPDIRKSSAQLKKYEAQRDFPALHGTSMASPHLRFGMVSIRELVSLSLNSSEKYLNELIWREFYMQILWHFPHPERAFKPAYDRIPWLADEEAFEKWCAGMTGYPLVDAGMRELNATGLMHNRVRMVTASFLTKHLLLDWRWGEAYFAAKLLDFELSSNNGGWQWASGSGCDAAPYFRVFNPKLQLDRFDAGLKYVKEWVPEYETAGYVRPMVVHEKARQRALETYKKALGGQGTSKRITK